MDLSVHALLLTGGRTDEDSKAARAKRYRRAARLIRSLVVLMSDRRRRIAVAKA
jgi:hypothetical protein